MAIDGHLLDTGAEGASGEENDMERGVFNAGKTLASFDSEVDLRGADGGQVVIGQGGEQADDAVGDTSGCIHQTAARVSVRKAIEALPEAFNSALGHQPAQPPMVNAKRPHLGGPEKAAPATEEIEKPFSGIHRVDLFS